MHESLDAAELLACEADQQRETGHDVTGIDLRVPAGTRLDDQAFTSALAALAAAPRRPDWPYQEPDDLAGIEAAAEGPGPAVTVELAHSYAERLRLAWAGRVAGNMLGKPVEWGDTWTYPAIEAHLRRHDAWPLTDYFPAVEPDQQDPPYRTDNWRQTTRGNVDGSARDDDVDYTVLNLHVLRRHGGGFGSHDVAQAWLQLLPFLQTYTAERAALRNLIEGRGVARAATYANPYREWIGALIRADVFGYVCPGDPQAAARLAYRDAALSHVGNGIYGEMWAAALVAAAFTAPTARAAVDTALGVVPRRSRLWEAIDLVRVAQDEGVDWFACRQRIEAELGHYGWVHTINNVALITAGVLYGGGDYTATIGLTVSGGLDTDSNGATAGSVGALLAGTVPEHWTAPLRDHVRSAVFGYDGSSIAELAAATAEVARSLVVTDAPVAPGPGPNQGW